MGDPISDVFVAMMRYSEIPRDFSSDSLRFAELGEDQLYRNLLDDSPASEASTHSGPALPLISPATPSSSSSSAAAAAAHLSAKKDSKSSNGHQYMKQFDTNTLGKIKDSRRRKNSDGSSSICNGGSGGGGNSSSNGGSNGGYYNYSLGSTPPNKTQSLPINASFNGLDTVILSALRVSPEELAGQITLLDFPEFARIQPDELTSCAWTNKKNKHIVAPNIVSFTKRFNHTSFWTVQEILSGATPKHRAEILSHFIKVAKKLYELNNLHSLFAIVSAMQTASIFRLSKTWSCLSKKDKHTFDRLADIFSDKDNWTNLREYLESLKLPCIPYLGLFLTDLVYIDLAHPHSGGLESEQRRNKMNNILRVISSYQGSDYGHIVPVSLTQKYLQSTRYIEELQNIFEDDQYKKSLKLEPPSSVPSSSSCSSKESVTPSCHISIDPSALASLNLSPAKSTSGSMRLTASSASKFIPGHRKCRSLGTKFRSTSLPRNFHQKCHCAAAAAAAAAVAAAQQTNQAGGGSNIVTGFNVSLTLPPNKCKCRIFNKANAQVAPATLTNGVGGCGGGGSNGIDTPLNHSRHLLDDSVIEDRLTSDATSTGSSEGFGCCSGLSGSGISGNSYTTGGNGTNGYDLNGGVYGMDYYVNDLSNTNGTMGFQGCVRRKTVLKDGRKPAVASWQRYWLQIWANKLVYFPPKSFKGTERTDFKREPCKVCPLDGWSSQLSDTNPQQMNTFQLTNTQLGTVYKFRTGSPTMTSQWLDALRRDSLFPSTNIKNNLMTSTASSSAAASTTGTADTVNNGIVNGFNSNALNGGGGGGNSAANISSNNINLMTFE